MDTDTIVQIILFFALVAEGGATRLLYSLILRLQKKNGKAFAVVTDVLTAIVGGCAMLATCFLLADSVRVFHAVFFIGGIALMHLALTPSAKKKRKRIDGTYDESDASALPAPAASSADPPVGPEGPA